MECGQDAKYGRWRALNMVQLLLFTWSLPPRVRDGVALTRGQAGCAHTTRGQVRGEAFQERFKAFMRDPRWKHNAVALAQSLAAQTFDIQQLEATYD